MLSYELMTITKSDLGEDAARGVSNSIKDQISANKGKVLNSEFWGKRKYAYKLGASTEGFYDVITLEMNPSSVAVLKNKLNLMEGLQRYLITKRR